MSIFGWLTMTEAERSTKAAQRKNWPVVLERFWYAKGRKLPANRSARPAKPMLLLLF